MTATLFSTWEDQIGAALMRRFMEGAGAPADFRAPMGEPALAAPDSLTWRIFKNPVALFAGGIAAVILELATAIGAIPVGIMLITDPSGAGVGFPAGWIEATPFGSYLVPGLYLLLANGVGMLLVAGLTLVRHWTAPWLTGVLGSGLAIWIGVQLLVMPEVSVLQAIYGAIGLVLAAASVAWLRRTRQLRLW